MPERVAILCQLAPGVTSALISRNSGFVCQTRDALFESPLRSSTTVIVVRSGIAVDASLLDALPALRLVVRVGSGVDNIDLNALASRGICLVRNPAVSAKAVAELGTAALVMLARRVPEAMRWLELGKWAKRDLMGESIESMTIGIWGAGPVGLACADQLGPLTRSVIFAAWPSVPPERRSVPADELCRVADAHVLCLPLRPTTWHIFDRDRLAETALRAPYLVNLGRFDAVHFGDAIAALKGRTLRGLFVDPIDEAHMTEVSSALSSNDALNLILSPHLGAQRADVSAALGEWVLQSVRQIHLRPPLDAKAT